MSQAQVMAAESTKPREVRERNAETIIEYDSVKLGGLDCRLMYRFADGKLQRAK
ncbi:MAG TPA: hypothetical protein VN841_21245 [Bryobacteraceae bacterium]|nr:hypothetical protein [Bryobacteraceae bacterium]